MSDRTGIFAGENPFELVKDWLAEARDLEPNDPNAMSLATVDSTGMPNVRVVLLKDITDDGFVFYTNYESAKAQELASAGKAAFVIHWKSLRRQIRVRGTIERFDNSAADAYYESRSVASRIGAWASDQSRPLESREVLQKRVDAMRREHGGDPKRPPHWGGYCITPFEIEFWADGANRLHDRFVWKRSNVKDEWNIQRLNP
ncbi:pyridoxine/pyridoxamine 5'-phosphate oxidase [Amylibacter ulvae]|uniref:Pyridoxine/pyridoxamine 5'-phosphate oxidase n=1 Tax=Paramylibacter ulvae TaxID=1651968 RepID=A0ABQ3CVH7_9RHOB|nr:pyridoxamine 5'-phosphate oxidase [Amylibacter ulvae]GHA45876.1 pyridoxine/pyridoxamine 5'-phosphate oxidase [Amylibacter ulvae]